MVSTRRSSIRERKELYPFPENHMDKNTIQPYIHNCIITVHERQNSYQYMVFFKRHCHLRPNNSLHKLRGRRPILNGDVIVMRIGSTSSYVNMRDRDHCETIGVVKNNPKVCNAIKLMKSVAFRYCGIYYFLHFHCLMETFITKYVTKDFEKNPT